MKKERVLQIVTMGMLAAVAYVVMVLIRIPVVSFLKYEPKDVIITIGGFMFGPLAAFLISFVVSLLEMVTVSDTGWIGALMNLISTCAFACTAAFVYKKVHNLKGAIIGLVAGAVVMIGVMMLWNYFLTPIYMGVDRAAVAAMLPTVFLPFNALKGGLNAVITMLLYKPVVTVLRKAHLVPPSESAPASAKSRVGITIAVVAVSLAVLAGLVILLLVMNGVIGGGN